MAEVYIVNYDRINFHAPIPDSYDVQEVIRQREQTIEDNLVRYVAEFRLGVKFDSFSYSEKVNSRTNERFLVANTQGPVRDIFRKAISTRENLGLPTRRESVECLGFEKLEQDLLSAPDKTLFMWVSPPGTKEEGYGNYSFTFVGQVDVDPESALKDIKVIPYRNVLSIEDHAAYFNKLTDEDIVLERDTDFLSHPVIIPFQKGAVEVPDHVLAIIGEQEKIDTGWNSRLREILGPLVQGYLELIRQRASEETLIQALHAIENISIAFKEDIVYQLKQDTQIIPLEIMGSVDDIFDTYGKHAPPQATGSCPPNNKAASGSATLMELQMMHGVDSRGSLAFECPLCLKPNVREWGKLKEECDHCHREIPKC